MNGRPNLAISASALDRFEARLEFRRRAALGAVLHPFFEAALPPFSLQNGMASW
jgi:hypothetical protein